MSVSHSNRYTLPNEVELALYHAYVGVSDKLSMLTHTHGINVWRLREASSYALHSACRRNSESSDWSMNHSCLVFRRLGVGGIGEDGADEQMEGDGGGIRGRCIPGRKKQPPHK